MAQKSAKIPRILLKRLATKLFVKIQNLSKLENFACFWILLLFKILSFSLIFA